MSGRTILVTGGAGFLGSHLCDTLLARGDRVIALDNLLTGRQANLAHLARTSRFRLVEHDVTAPLPESLRFDEIYNLASAASPPDYQRDPVHTLETNVLGALNLLRVARERGIKILQASTSEVYGDPERHPQTEDYWGHVNPVGPRACYDEGKRAAESAFLDFHRAHGVSVKVARIFNTYGPRMRADDGRVVSNLICQALAGQPLTIYGDGSQTRSLCYVDDLVRGLVALMESGPEVTGPVNLGNPLEISILDLAQRVQTLTGSRSAIVRRPLPQDDPRRRCPSIELAMRVLGWRPQIGLDQGLTRTIADLAGQLGLERVAVSA